MSSMDKEFNAYIPEEEKFKHEQIKIIGILYAYVNALVLTTGKGHLFLRSPATGSQKEMKE